MLFIFGIRTIRIGRYFDKEHICFPCRAYDREVLVYRSYFHFCLIPVFPVGKKKIVMSCQNCGDETRLENVIREYEGRARTPFYLYSAILLFIAIGGVWYFWNKQNKQTIAERIQHPQVGDVYTFTQKGDIGSDYYFMRLAAFDRDSVRYLENHLVYSGFVSNFSENDYFMKEDTVVFSRADLKFLLKKGAIEDIRRGYDQNNGFNRIK